MESIVIYLFASIYYIFCTFFVFSYSEKPTKTFSIIVFFIHVIIFSPIETPYILGVLLGELFREKL